MAPKKKGGAKGAAKSAEVAQKVAELQFEQERERLRNEEVMLRQRVEEEEHKILESHRVREAETRNAVSERERKAYYEAREKELVEQAELREREVQELRATVAGLQQAQQFLESERESAIRRTALLNNELELAQLRHLEAEALAEANERSYQDTARTLEEKGAEYQETLSLVRAECRVVEGRLSELQQKHTELQRQTRVIRPATGAKAGEAETGEGEGAEEGHDVTDVDPRSVDAETTVLLKVLNEEVSKYKELATQLQTTLDRKDRDEEKSSLLVGILNTQLDSVREENKRLYFTSQNRLKEVEATQTVLDEERARNKQLYEQFDRATSEAAVQQRQLQLEVGVHRTQAEELTTKLDELRREHRELQGEHKAHVGRSLNREQEDFQTNVAMKGELEKQKVDMAALLKAKQKQEEEAFNYKVLSRAEVDSLKIRLQKFQEAMEKADRTSYETITVLRADTDRLTAERSVAESSHKEEESRLLNDLERVTEQRDSLQGKLTAVTQRAAATEKELYEKLVHMTACHDTRGEEVDRLRGRLQEKEEEYTNNAIYLNAEKENLRAKLEDLQQDGQKRRREHIQHIDKVTSELADLQGRLTREIKDLSETRKAEADRADFAERNVKRMQEQLQEAHQKARDTQLDNEKVVKSLKAECCDARGELAIAKRTIERLEVALGDQAGFVQLTELNGKLMKEVDGYRRQVTGLNSTVASMRVEQEVMDGYKVQKLGEEKEKLLRRVTQLERYQHLTFPLFAELRSIAERSVLPTGLRDSLTKYDSQVSRMSRKEMSAVTGATAAADAVEGEAAAVAFTSTLPAMLRPAPPMQQQRRVLYASVDKLPGNSNGAAVATNHLPYIDV